MPWGNRFHSQITSIVRDFSARRLAASELVTEQLCGPEEAQQWLGLSAYRAQRCTKSDAVSPALLGSKVQKPRQRLASSPQINSVWAIFAACPAQHYNSVPILGATVEPKALLQLTTGTDDPGLLGSQILFSSQGWQAACSWEIELLLNQETYSLGSKALFQSEIRTDQEQST